MLVLVATPTMAGLEDFTRGLIDCGAEVVHARSGMAALELARTRAPALVVVDGELSDFGPFELVRELSRMDAAINTAVMTYLDPEAFHEKAEGFGVLESLSTQPDAQAAAGLMRRLESILGRTFPA